jgi:exopolyphosphatase/guanosine-5'-triphosphate,3'-diphosphate pyrophosphatase
LLSVLELFRVPLVYYSAAGVRDGVIADLAARGVGREAARLNTDERRELERMTVRYGVAREHVRKVAAFAASLFHELEPLHKLAAPYGRLLEASGYLHDVGHFISDASHHKHSYYVVANSDMPGFTARERELIANLCRYHRKALPSADHPNLKALSPEDRDALGRLIPLLRLADALDRSHAQRVTKMECTLRDGEVALDLDHSGDVGLEKWAVEMVSPLFEEVYSHRIAFRG